MPNLLTYGHPLLSGSYTQFDQGTLRILHSILASQHAQQSKFRNNLFAFIRSKAKLVVEYEITDKSVKGKLPVLQFLVRAFALSGDVQSCLALRYEERQWRRRRRYAASRRRQRR
ncbi:hypothetical protein Scep_029896 [Stephania cephalantha]|uniref:Uncharacterized protein n=1 Tax=Stephania cephalantha TaxID=152367 RepID=A0AAP0DYJ1_9MAGN